MGLSKRVRVRRVAVVALLSLLIGVNTQHISSIAAYAAESISWNFNTDQLSDFDKYAPAGYDHTSWSSTGGIGDSGTIYIDATQNVRTVYTSKAGYSLGPVGSTYKFTAFMFSQGSPGYIGMGFTASAPTLSTTGVTSSIFRPNDALGVSVHGSGYSFHNGAANYASYWNSSWGLVPDGVTRTKEWLDDGDGTAGIINCSGYSGSTEDCWFKVVYTIERTGTSTFDTKVEVWEANSDGSLDDATVDTIQELNGVTNTTFASADTIYSYINFSGTRMEYFDNFSVELTGGASVIAPGAPVVLTSSSSESNGVITVGGNVTSNNGSAVTERGFVYGTSTEPTISGNKVADASSGTGTYSGTTPQLADGTYYVRAYATNSTGTSYGSQATVTVTSPTVTFEKNDGSGATASQASRTSGALTPNPFSRSGYIFTGWNSDRGGIGTAYSDGATFSFTSDATLYAQWTATASGSSGGLGTSGGTTPALVIPSPATDPRPRLPRQSNPVPTTRPLVAPLPQLQPGFPPVSSVTIGGVPTPLTTAKTSTGSLSIAAGKFSLNVGVSNGGEVAQDAESDQLEITVTDGSSASISGAGLRPFTAVQVWLPGVREGELGRVAVDANGSIAGSVNLGTSAGELPLPIGKRVLQVTGFDEDGNQAVIELPINIAQSAPAPERNRQAGSLPDLAPTEALYTSAGMPIIASATPLLGENLLAVDGGDWAMSVTLAAGAGAIAGEQDAPLLTMQQSGVGAVFGSGFQPGTVASVWLFSDPTLLATTQVAEDGTISTDFLVDGQFISAGEHTLQIQAVGTDGYIKSANIGVAVVEPPQATASMSPIVLLWLAAAGLIALFLLIIVGFVAKRGRKVA